MHSLTYLIISSTRALRNSFSKNSNLLKMFWPSGHPRCRWVCIFIGTDLEKISITSHAHQWILCNEWVPSEWEPIQLMKTSQVVDMTPVHLFISCKAHSCVFVINRSIIKHFNSHSDGTHSLQRIHWWACNLICSDYETNWSTPWIFKGWVNFSFFTKLLF